MSNRPPPSEVDVPPAEVRRRSRRAFAVWVAAGLAGLGGWRWLRTRDPDDGTPWPLRAAHRFNERVGRGLFGPTRLAREFPPAAAADPKVNGRHGWPDPGGERLVVEQPGHAPRTFDPAAALAGLERVETTTELKCIEGWSQVVTWGGVRFADFAARLGTGAERHPFVGLATADGAYYVGLDAPSALHPQTLLCDRMNGGPLPAAHGGPLRLVIPVKYGIKNIKWLARVRFRDDRPADYWAEQGYDWYAGL